MTENPQPYGNPAFEQPGQQPGSKYGTAAYDAGAGAFGQDVTEPKKFDLLKKLTLGSLGIYLVSGILSFVTSGNEAIMDATLEEQSAQLGIPQDQLEQGMAMGMAFAMGLAVVMLIVALAIYLVVYLGLRKAKNWGRILGTVFAVIGTLFTLWGLTEMGVMMSVAPGLGIASLVLTVLFVLVNVWWLVTAFSKDVNEYLRARA